MSQRNSGAKNTAEAIPATSAIKETTAFCLRFRATTEQTIAGTAVSPHVMIETRARHRLRRSSCLCHGLVLSDRASIVLLPSGLPFALRGAEHRESQWPRLCIFAFGARVTLYESSSKASSSWSVMPAFLLCGLLSRFIPFGVLACPNSPGFEPEVTSSQSLPTRCLRVKGAKELGAKRWSEEEPAAPTRRALPEVNMVRKAIVAMAVTVASFSGAVCAGDAQVLAVVKEQVVGKKATAELPFDLPEVKRGQQVRLSIDVRVNYPYWCANNPAMTMEVNGKPVVGRDLINKPLDYQSKNGREAFWTTPNGSSWLLFSWPDFSVEKVKAFDSPYALPDTDPFHFVFDITAYVKPGANSIKVFHPDILPEVDHYLVFRDVQVEVGDPVESRNLTTAVKPAPTGGLPTYVPRGKQKVKMQVELSDRGLIRLTIGRRSFDIETRTSEPRGQWRFTGKENPKVVPRGKSLTAKWRCEGYAISRTVSVHDDHFLVADTFTNTGKELVGVMLEHRVRWMEPPLDIKLAGRPSFARYQNESGGANPTAVARWADLAVGLVAEDDVLRPQVLEFAHEDAFGLADHELGIEPGKSHTLEWSVYPVPNGDYWDFINAVRRNWGSNITIPGPHVFVDWSFHTKPEEWNCNWVRSRGVTMVTAPDAMFEDGKPAMGTAIPMARPFCERTADWIEKLRKAAPEVKSLFYINCTLCTEPGAAEKYADSRLMDPSGNQHTMSAGCRSGGYIPAPLFVSTLNNSYGKAMMQTVKYIMEEVKPDGLYHDVFASEGFGARAFGIEWDGCTVRINRETHEVTGKCSSVALLERGWHVELVKYLRDRGKVIFGNGPGETRTRTNLKIPTFVETYFSASVVRDTHLSTPWGYGNLPWADPARGYYYNTAYNLRKILNFGGVIALPSWSEEPKGTTFLQLLYPITPIEIREGMVIGEERLLTNRSGRYGWPDGSKADVFVFDGEGKLVPKPLVTQAREGGKLVMEVRMPSDHFAILVRTMAASR